MKLDIHNETWRSVKAWATDRRDKYRRQNETNGRSELEYAQLRARLAELEALLTLPTEETQ